MKILRIHQKVGGEAVSPLWFMEEEAAKSEARRLESEGFEPASLELRMTRGHRILADAYHDLALWLSEGRFGGAPLLRDRAAFDPAQWKEIPLSAEGPLPTEWASWVRELKKWEEVEGNS